MAEESVNAQAGAADPGSAEPPGKEENSGPPIRVNKTWCKNAFFSAIYFAPYAVKPAVLITIASVAMMAGYFMYFSICLSFQRVENSIVPILKAMIVLLITSIVSLCFWLWGVGSWLMRLTIYCSSFLSLSKAELTESKLLKKTFQEARLRAVEAVAGRKEFLAKAWLLSGLPMVPLLMVATGCSAVILGTFLHYANSPAPLYDLPLWVKLVLGAVASILFVYMVLLSLLGLAVSSVSTLTPGKAVQRALGLSFRFMIPGMGLTLLLLTFNVIIGSPQMIFTDWRQMIQPTDLTAEILANLWQGLTSLILWTLTMAPFCELVRNRCD